MNEIKVVYVDIDNIKGYENNAKRHPQEQIEQIKKSIQLYGMNDPIALWKNNEIIEGHGRLQACIELGMEQVPCFFLDKLTDKERREYMLVHNQTTMNSGWDFEKLEAELDDLDFDGFDFGFTEEFDDIDYLDAMGEKFGTQGEVNNSDFTVVSLTFDKTDGELVRSYIKRNEQAGVVKAVLDYVRGYDA